MGEIISAITSNIGVIHIILFALGIIFLVAEMFEPGFGVFGSIGVILMVVDIFLLADNLAQGFVLFAGLAILIIFLVIIFIILVSNGIIPEKLVLSDSTDNEKGYVATETVNLEIGEKGTTITQLRPTGKALFKEVGYEVVSQGEFIEKGEEIIITSMSGNRIVVKRV